MKDKILDIAKNCLETNDSLKSICKEIKFVSLKFLGIWFCFAFSNNFESGDLFKNSVFCTKYQVWEVIDNFFQS
jgi:hypothetical protein